DRMRARTSTARAQKWMRRVVAESSVSLPAFDPLLERRRLALVLDAQPVRVVGRRCLIACGRCGHALARRLAGERLGLRRRRRKRRHDRTEQFFGFGAEFGGHHRTGGIVSRLAVALGIGGLSVAALCIAGLVEFGRPPRPPFLFHADVGLERRLLSLGPFLTVFCRQVLL